MLDLLKANVLLLPKHELRLHKEVFVTAVVAKRTELSIITAVQ